MKNTHALALVLIAIIATSILVWTITPAIENYNPIDVGAEPVQFTDEELQTFQIHHRPHSHIQHRP